MFPVNVLLCCQILNEDKVDSRLLRESLTALSPGILMSRSIFYELELVYF